MRCKAVQERLGAYLDGELPDEMRKDIEEHIAQCPTCSAELARLRRLHQLLNLIPGIEVPVGFARAVRARAERGSSQADRKLIPLYPAGSMVFVRLAAMIAIVFGLTLGGFMSSSVARLRSGRTEPAAQTQPQEQTAGLLTVVPPGSVTEAYLQLLEENE